MTKEQATAKAKEIIETWEHATNHAPTGEWSADIFLASPEGSRLVGELVEDENELLGKSIKRLGELVVEKTEWKEESERLAELVAFWQKKYYDEHPAFQPPKLDHL